MSYFKTKMHQIQFTLELTFTLHYITVNYIRYLKWLKYKTAIPLLYMVYKTRNQKQLERKWLRKQKSWGVGAEVTSDGRLFQRQPQATGKLETHYRQQWTAVYVGSLAATARMTTV